MKREKVLCFLLCFLLVFTSFRIKVYANTNAITKNTANMRSGAGVIFNTIETLNGNTSVQVVGRELGWYKVNYNGKTGFIIDNLITINDGALLENLSYIKYNYQELASFTTYFSTGAKNRNHNIELSAYKNYVTIKPGSTFSFNKNTGNSSLKSAGWQEAGVIVNKKMDVGIGGGICQTSSTIHSAVRQLSSLKITERYPHSIPVGYVRVEQEAMVNYPSNDFKFRNDFDFPVVIFNEVNHLNGSIKAGVYKANETIEEPKPIPFDVDKDIKRVFSEKLVEIANKPELFFDAFEIDKENVLDKYYDITFTIYDIDEDGIEDLMLDVTIHTTKNIDNEIKKQQYDNIIIYTYKDKKINEVGKIKTKEDGFLLINDFKLFRNKETGATQWLRKDYINKEALKITKGFALGESITFDELEELYTKQAYNETIISAANIEEYKSSEVKRPGIKSKVILDGEEVKYNVPPQNIDKRLYVEVRSLFETLGYNVLYDDETKVITIFNDDKTFYFDEGEKSTSIRLVEDGKESVIPMDFPIKIVNDRTMVSLRFVGELLGYEVSWDDGISAAILNSINYNEPIDDVENEDGNISDGNIEEDENDISNDNDVEEDDFPYID